MKPDTAGRREQLAEFLTQIGPVGLVPVLLLVGLGVSQGFDTVAFGVLSPEIRRTFHLSNAGIDAIASLTGAVPILCSIFLGYLGDRGNRVRLSRYAAVIFAAMAVLTGLAPVVVILILARTIGGVGLLSTQTLYPSLISDWYPPETLGSVFTILLLGVTGVGLLGSPLAGGMAGALGWRPTFVILALPTLVFVALTRRLREPDRGASQGAVRAEALGGIGEGFRRIRAIRTLQRTWTAAFLFGAGTIPFATLLSNFYNDVYHVGPFARGAIGAAYGVGGLFGIVGGGALTRRVVVRGRPELLAVINGLAVVEFGVFAFVMGVMPLLGLSLAAAVLLALGAAGFLPAYTTVVAMVAPARLRSQAYAWSLFFYSLGAILGGAVIGGVADAHGQRSAMVLLSVLVVAGGAVSVSAARFVPRDIAQASRNEEMAQSDAFLSCSGVDAAYGGVQVLFGVDFEVRAGEIVALLGTNGAGKSTFLKTISGLLDPIGGVIYFEGRDITHAGPMVSSRLGVAHVPGGRGVFPGMNVADNLKAAGWLYRKDQAYLRTATEEVLGYFPILRERMGTLAGDLSGGEQQMLSLAKAFISRPRLLLIDELSLGLAPTVVQRLLEIVRAIHARGTTVVLVEQSVNIALELAERAVFMEKGAVRFSGPTADLLGRPDILRAVFLKTDDVVPAPRKSSSRSEDRPTVLETRGVSCRYGGVMAVDSVHVQLRQGEILGFVGPNGAGKTTLFDLVSGFTRLDAGRILLAGRDVTEWSPARRSRAGLGRSFQDARLWPALTVAETLTLALHERAAVRGVIPSLLGPPVLFASEEALMEEAERLIEFMGLGAFRDKFVSELSTGSRRVVELACMLAHRPSVLLLDEPSSGIAQRETEALGPLIRRIRDELGCSIMIIEHDIPLIRGLAERMVALDLGRVVTVGTPKEVLVHPQVVESYLGTSADQLPGAAAPVPTPAPRRARSVTKASASGARS
jgi:ABC-type branched-subunit amino acid transport system ATPase component/predicted MFS family arabinose efflux permease